MVVGKREKNEEKEELPVLSGGKIIAPKDIAKELRKQLVGVAGEKFWSEYEKLDLDEQKKLRTVVGGALVGSIGGLLTAGLGAGAGAIVYIIYDSYKKDKIKFTKPELNLVKKLKKVFDGATVEISRTEGKTFIELITKFGKFSYKS